MSTVIQIKRSTGASAPTTTDLAEGELAYSQDRTNNGAGAILYIESIASDGTTQVIDKIGGKYYTETVDAFLTPATGTVGAKAVFKDGDGSASITLKAPDTLAGNLTYTLPASVTADYYLKTDASGNLSFAAIPSGSFTINGDGTTTDEFTTGQTLTFTGSTGVTTSVADVTGNTVVTISGVDASTTAKGVAQFNSTNFSVAAGVVAINSVEGGKVNINGTTALTALVNDDEFLVYDASVPANRKITAQNVGSYVYAGVSGDITIASNGVATIGANSVALGTDTTGNYVASIANGSFLTGGAAGSEGATLTLGVDATHENTVSKVVARDTSGNFSAGTITAALNGNASTASAWQTSRTITLGGDLTGNVSIDGSANVTLTATVAANSVALGTDTTGNYVATVAGTSNQIAVTGSGSETAAVTVALTDNVTLVGDLTVGGNNIKSSAGTTAITLDGANVTVAGNLTINGSSTIVNSTTVTIDDVLLKLADNNTGNSVDTGVYGQYVESTVTKYAGWFRDASDNNIFKFFTGLQTEPTTTVDTTATGYTRGTVVANLTGGTVSSLASAIGVADGGTGAATFTTNGVLYGNGTGAIQATAAGTNNYILKSNNGVPTWSNVIDGGTY
jgi:hypothetical protein